MEYRRMGRTGLKVSEICLGTMTFGHSTDEEEAVKIVDLAFDAGVNFFDTANAYSGHPFGDHPGQSAQRADAATRSWPPSSSTPWAPAPTIPACRASISCTPSKRVWRRLQMDYVDIYYIHHVDTETPLEEMLRALDDLVTQGKVRYIACSNYEAWRLWKRSGSATARVSRASSATSHNTAWWCATSKKRLCLSVN